MENAHTSLPELSVAGIAGPGDPLATPAATVATLRLVRARCPDLLLCLSTNGLELPSALDDLLSAELDCLTVTMNSMDGHCAGYLAGKARVGGRVLTGKALGDLLISRQLAGIQKAVSRGLLCMVNMVLVPGVNDGDVSSVSRMAKGLGVRFFNLIPVLQPQSRTVSFRSATSNDIQNATKLIPAGIALLTHCQRCRGDAVGLLGCDLGRGKGNKYNDR